MRMIRKISEEQETLRKVETGMNEISPLVTKALMEKFEQSGISPVFLVNKKITELKCLHEDEYKDLANELKKHCHSENDFWFVGYDQTKYQTNSVQTPALILVISKKSGKSKDYNGNTILSFSKDLENKYF